MVEFSLIRKIEREYAKGIRRLLSRILENCRGKTAKQIAEYLSRIGDTREFRTAAKQLAQTMVTAVRVRNAKNWREAALKGTRGAEIRKALKNEMSGAVGLEARDIAERNAALISSVPRDLAEEITKAALDDYAKGFRYSENVNRILERAPYLTKSRATLIARTEASKANEALTEVRARNLDISCYIWRSSHDERVRSTHEQMDGILCFWDSPPDPEAFFGGGSQFGAYHAGCCPNCRCYAEPVVDMDSLPDTIRCCINGQKPKQMGKRQLMEKFGNG